MKNDAIREHFHSFLTTGVIKNEFIAVLNGLTDPGRIDAEFAERVNRLARAKLTGVETGAHWILSFYDGGHLPSICRVTHRHQVVHILAAYGLEVPE